MSAILTFPSVTPEQYAALEAQAAAAGIDITGSGGQVQAHGCTVAYRYLGHQGGNGPLTLTLLHAPPFCGGIALHKLHDLVDNALNQQPVAPAEKSNQ